MIVITPDQRELEDKILELVNLRDEVTTSDMQGIVSVLAMNYRKKESILPEIKDVFIAGGDRKYMSEKVEKIIEGK